MALQYDLIPPKQHSFESWMLTTEAAFAFLDFKKFRGSGKGARRRFFMKGSVNHQNAKTDWVNVYDGVFYIREMYPCKR